MTFDELVSAEPTEVEYISKKIVLALVGRVGWRCYSSVTMDSRPLIDRYLRSHASIKGLLADEVLALRPATIFFWKDEDGGVYKGATFLNGAVLIARPTSSNQVVSLFIDETTATKWGYPKGYHYLNNLSE